MKYILILFFFLFGCQNNLHPMPAKRIISNEHFDASEYRKTIVLEQKDSESISILEKVKLKVKKKRENGLKKLEEADSLEDFLCIQKDIISVYGYQLSENEIAMKRKLWYLNNQQDLSQKMKSIILESKWQIGMSRNDLCASLGIPEKINRTISASMIREQWIYDYNITIPFTSVHYFYFENGILISWQD